MWQWLAYLASGEPSSRNRAATGSTLSGNSRRTRFGPMSSTTADRWRAAALRTIALRWLHTCPNTQRNVNSRQQRANQIAVKRPQTSAKTSNLNQKWSGIRNKISESIHNSTFGSGYLQNRFHDVMDSLPSWRQSYHRVSWKSAGDWMRNTVNLLKCPILQWRGKWKSDPESVSGIGSPPKVSKFFWLVGPSITTSFNEIGSLLLQYCCTEAEWQARSSHRMTDGPHWSHNVRLGCVHYQLWSTLSCRALTGQ